MSDAADKMAAAAEAYSSYGCWIARDGQFRIFCGFCRSWCDAEVTLVCPIHTDGAPSVAVEYGLSIEQNTLQLHVSLRLHVHDHECVEGREALITASRED